MGIGLESCAGCCEAEGLARGRDRLDVASEEEEGNTADALSLAKSAFLGERGRAAGVVDDFLVAFDWLALLPLARGAVFETEAATWTQSSSESESSVEAPL
jgi:hypothetical protein